jgi:hypothetical protein
MQATTAKIIVTILKPMEALTTLSQQKMILTIMDREVITLQDTLIPTIQVMEDHHRLIKATHLDITMDKITHLTMVDMDHLHRICTIQICLEEVIDLPITHPKRTPAMEITQAGLRLTLRGEDHLQITTETKMELLTAILSIKLTNQETNVLQ